MHHHHGPAVACSCNVQCGCSVFKCRQLFKRQQVAFKQVGTDADFHNRLACMCHPILQLRPPRVNFTRSFTGFIHVSLYLMAAPTAWHRLHRWGTQRFHWTAHFQRSRQTAIHTSLPCQEIASSTICSCRQVRDQDINCHNSVKKKIGKDLGLHSLNICSCNYNVPCPHAFQCFEGCCMKIHVTPDNLPCEHEDLWTS